MNATASILAARAATPDDMNAVAVLLHEVFGIRTHSDILRWKYAGAAGRWVGSTILTVNGRVAGFLGQIPVRIRAGGQDWLAAQGADVAILSEHRRLDAFLALTSASTAALRHAGVSLVYGIANSVATDPLSVLLGEQHVAPVPLLVRPLGKLLPAPPRRPGYARVVRLDGFDRRVDRLWFRTRDDYPIMLAKDAAHLNWRYAEGSGRAYERLAIEHPRTGEIEGYTVLTVETGKGKNRGRICDLVTPKGSGSRIASALIAESLRWFQSRNVGVADIWMFRHSHLYPTLLRHCFIPRKANPGGLHAAPLAALATACGNGFAQPTQWHLSLGDSDTV